MEEKKKEQDVVSLILYGIYLVVLAASIFLVGRIAAIQLFFKPDEKIERLLTQKVVRRTLEPQRGEILDCKGRPLALSYPRYQLYMDCTVRRKEFERNKKKGVELEARWIQKADSLSRMLPTLFPEHNYDWYYKTITNGRKNGKKHVKIGSPIERPELLRAQTFPLFREGQNRGGLIVEAKNVRRSPFGKLARRTIGFVRDENPGVTNNAVGLEGRFDSLLCGTPGVMWLKKTDDGLVRCFDSTYVEAVDGKDVHATLDIDFQQIADKALRDAIGSDDQLEGGCLVLMDVNSGAVRAMVNLYQDPKTKEYEEFSNYAVGRAAEPGSVFKITTLMTMLEKGYVTSLEQTIPGNHGLIDGYSYEKDRHITEYEQKYHTSRIPLGYCVQVSSNYAFRYLAIKHYENRPQEFIDRLGLYGLDRPFDFEIEGLARPVIPSPKSKTWSKTDLGQIAMGYTVKETPLHILMFYNAIAGKGRLVKPYLSEEAGPQVLCDSICSPRTAEMITEALKGVTEDGGTATRLKKARCKVAGKTGTSRVILENGKYTDEQGRFANQGTFVGFFPAEAPRYSIICCVYSKPSKKSYYGGTIPAEAVRSVVDRIYCIDPYWQKTI